MNYWWVSEALVSDYLLLFYNAVVYESSSRKRPALSYHHFFELPRFPGASSVVLSLFESTQFHRLIPREAEVYKFVPRGSHIRETLEPLKYFNIYKTFCGNCCQWFKKSDFQTIATAAFNRINTVVIIRSTWQVKGKLVHMLQVRIYCLP